MATVGLEHKGTVRHIRDQLGSISSKIVIRPFIAYI